MENALPFSLHRAVWSPLDLTFLVFAFMTLYSLPYTVLMTLLIQLSTFPPIPYVSVNCFFPFIPAVLLRYLWQCNPLLRLVFLCIFSCLLMLWSVYFLLRFLSVKWVILPASFALCLIHFFCHGRVFALPSALLGCTQWLIHPLSCPIIQPSLQKV